MELPSEPGPRDDDAWVRLEGDPPGRRWYLAGNSHTHRGRVHVETDDGLAHTIVSAHPRPTAVARRRVQEERADR